LKERIYLDHAATTPVLEQAARAVGDAFAAWANPSSAHSEGRGAHAALEDARGRVAAALGWNGLLLFTSGASESIEIVMRRARAGGRIVSALEHPAVMRHAEGASIIPARRDGSLDLDVLAHALAGTVRQLVAVQCVNNETGVIHPIDAIRKLVRDAGGLLLVDCAQSAGKIALPDADFLVVAAHKLGGPPGVGALLVSNPADLDAIGGQEQGYRPGTVPVPLAIGFATALECDHAWFANAQALRDRLEAGIIDAGGEIIAAASPRIPTIGAYRMPGVPAAAQMMQLDLAGIAVSAGSACSSGTLKPSSVLAAMGMEPQQASEVIRVSFGPETCDRHVDAFLDEWSRLARRRSAA
jgi:cysteine desulfurase